MQMVTLDCVSGARLERIEEAVTALASKLGVSLEAKPEPEAKPMEEPESVADFAARYWARKRAGA